MNWRHGSFGKGRTARERVCASKVVTGWVFPYVYRLARGCTLNTNADKRHLPRPIARHHSPAVILQEIRGEMID